MERQFFSGNSLEQAILAAARHYDLDPERVAYTLRDKKHGFLNIRRRVVIEVDPAAPEHPEGVSGQETDEVAGSDAPVASESPEDDERPLEDSREARAKSSPAGSLWQGSRREAPQKPLVWEGSEMRIDGRGDSSEDATGGEVEALEKAVEELGELVGMSFEPTIRQDEDGFEVDVRGSDSSHLRENRGSGLTAMEHLLPRMVRGLNGRGVPCRVDSEGYREAHEEELQQLARRTAEEVRQDGEERCLKPMNPADRRVVHMALAEDATVVTESEGQGFMKRVWIEPA